MSAPSPQEQIASYVNAAACANTKQARGDVFKLVARALDLPSVEYVTIMEVDDVRRYRDSMTAKGYAPGTIAQRLTLLKMFFKYQIAMGWRDVRNPADPLLVKPPRVQTVSGQPWLTRDQVSALVRTCGGTTAKDKRDRAIILTTFTHGLRVSEVAAMKCSTRLAPTWRQPVGPGATPGICGVRAAADVPGGVRGAALPTATCWR